MKTVWNLITNDHVVDDAVEIVFGFCKADDTGAPLDREQIWIKCDLASWKHHPDPNVDLQCFPLAGLLKELDSKQIRFFTFHLTQN